MRVIGDLSRVNARRYPDKVALVHGERSLTYRQLDERSIAKKLAAFEAKQDAIDSGDVDGEQDVDNALAAYEAELRKETIDRAAPLKADLIAPGPWRFGIGSWGECLPYHANRMSLNKDLRDKWGLPTVTFDCEW